MRTLKTSSKTLLGLAFGAVVAYVVAVAAAGAYREGEILDVLATLALPPFALSFVYKGSEKRAIFCLGSLLIAAALFDVSPALRISRTGLTLFLLTIGAIATPVFLDLILVDMGRQFRVDSPAVRLAQLAFMLALLPFSGWTLMGAHETILKEDQKLIGELASRITPEGNALVLDRLDPKMRDRAQRRLAIRTNNKTYQLSDADTESVREERTVRRETNTRGGSQGTQITKEQEERLRLILKLQGMGIPDDVVIFSHRGPLTIYEVKVPLNKHGS